MSNELIKLRTALIEKGGEEAKDYLNKIIESKHESVTAEQAEIMGCMGLVFDRLATIAKAMNSWIELAEAVMPCSQLQYLKMDVTSSLSTIEDFFASGPKTPERTYDEQNAHMDRLADSQYEELPATLKVIAWSETRATLDLPPASFFSNDSAPVLGYGKAFQEILSKVKGLVNYEIESNEDRSVVTWRIRVYAEGYEGLPKEGEELYALTIPVGNTGVYYLEVVEGKINYGMLDIENKLA